MMPFDAERLHRRSVRLRGWDYASVGAYFVTVVTQGRVCVFGDVVNNEMHLNDAGQRVWNVWDGLPDRYPGVDIDAFVVMLNHVHGIVVLHSADHTDAVGAQFIAPNPVAPNPVAGNPPPAGIADVGAMDRAPTDRAGPPRPPALGEIVRAFKAISTLSIRRSGFPSFAWQRNYHEHIIRTDTALDRIREYIHYNPRDWPADAENPDHR